MKLTDAERTKAKQRALAAQQARLKREQTILEWDLMTQLACCSTYGGHICYWPQNHDEPHYCECGTHWWTEDETDT